MELLSPQRIAEALRSLSWHNESGALHKVVRRQDFADAVAYVVEVAELAEQAGHHPDIDVRWNVVTLRLSTHSLGGITDADLDLARRIDAITP